MQTRYDVFISYSRADNIDGRITRLVECISEDFLAFAGRPLRLFLDKTEIAGMDDWRHRILKGLRESRLLLACLSPTYLRSEYCEWEFNEYLKNEVASAYFGDGVAPIYFVEVPGWQDREFERQCAAWVAELRRRHYFDLRSWVQEGRDALHESVLLTQIRELNTAVRSRIQRGERHGHSPGNVDAHNPHFVGRLPELRRLREAVALGRVGILVALHGLGGVGKTALAIEYAHAFAHDYGGGRWQVRCEGKDDLRDGLAELSKPLGVEFTAAEHHDVDLRFERIVQELRLRAEASDPPRCLLVLDNVDRPALLDPAATQRLPSADWLHVIATSRHAESELYSRHPDRAFLPVDELPERDAIALIESHQLGGRFPSEAEREAAREIVTLLGRFTLAVETAAVYLGEFSDSVTCAGFLSRLKTEGLAGLDSAATQASDSVLHQEKRVSVTLAPTLERLSELETLALSYAALMPADHIPLSWIRALVAEDFNELARDSQPGYPNPWTALVRRLLGLRLLQLTSVTDSDGKMVVCRMHRLLQELCAVRIPDARRLRARVSSYAMARGDAWVARSLNADQSGSLGDLLFDTVLPMDFRQAPQATVEGNVWEADCMLALSHKLMLQGGDHDGLRLSSSVATPIAIETLSQHLRPVLRSTDQIAKKSKYRYGQLTRISLVTGVLGLLAIIVLLAFPVDPAWSVAMITAILSATVSIGVWARTPAERARWLLNRYKYELCRQCEFRAITSEDLWSGRTQAWREAVVKEADRIANLPVESLGGLSGDRAPPATTSTLGSALPGPLLEHILLSYRRRLEDQFGYYDLFIERYQRNQGGWMVGARIAFLSAFIGTIAVCALLIVAGPQTGGAAGKIGAAVALAILSAPVLSIGVRAVRRSLAASAFTRETLATRDALYSVLAPLGDNARCANDRHDEILSTLRKCERLISAEFWTWHRSQMEYH